MASPPTVSARTHAWRPRTDLYVFASASDAPRSRRPVDALKLALAAAIVALAFRDSDRVGRLGQITDDIIGVLPSWLGPVFGLAYTLATLWAVGLIIGIGVVAHRRKAVLRDLILAVVVALGVSTVIAYWANGQWPTVRSALLDWSATEPSFPVLRLALVASVLLTAAPHLSRPMRRLGVIVLTAAAVAAMFQGFGELADVVGGLALGVVASALVHLVFGSSGGIPTANRVRESLGELGVASQDLEAAAVQSPGVSLFTGTTEDGASLVVKVYGRDAAQAQFWSKTWRMLWYRDGGPTLALSRVQEVEHEAFVTLLAERAGVATSTVMAAGSAGAGDALLAVTPPAGILLSSADAEAVTDEDLGILWTEQRRMAGAGIAHGSLDGAHLVIGPSPAIVNFEDASIGATPEQVGADAAELLTSMVSAVGEDRAMAAARQARTDEELAELLPFLQPAALSRAGRRELKDSEIKLKSLRSRIAEESGVDQPQLQKIRRVKLTDLAMLAVTLMAAWLLISQLAEVGIDQVLDELSTAQIPWLIVAFLFALSTNIGTAIAVMGAVPRPLPLGPTFVLQYAINFINLVIPSAAGRIAMQVRYLQKFGVEPVAAVAQGTLDSVAGFIVQILLLALLWPITDIQFDLDSSSGVNTSWVVWVLAAMVVLGVISIIGVLVVPTFRKRVLTPVIEGVKTLQTAFRSPRKTAMLFGGNILSQVLYAIALGASVNAYGGSASLAELIVVNTVVTLFAGLMPIPGGVGVAEAALTAGLVAIGLPQSTAFAAAITHRMLTYYLPPIWGWFAFRWLSRKSYL